MNWIQAFRQQDERLKNNPFASKQKDSSMTKTTLSGDRPQENPEDNDALGYAPFAKSLARSIVKMSPESGIVLGIYAAWGSGKTTLLNFVQHYLREYEAECPRIISFNPWWFTGQEDLARIFFAELFTALGKEDKYKDLREKVATYADLAGLIPKVGEYAKEIAKAVRPTDKSISELKVEIGKALKESKEKLLVIIDDIDRLTAEETRQLFRVVKAVGDFPNVIYLLAFDRDVAANALESIHAGDGHAYLEKIIQVPFALPMPDNAKLRDMFFERVDDILNPDDKGINRFGLLDLGYWWQIYDAGIRPFLETPRDVVRLCNTLTITYPGVHGEVNPADFIAIETLRVFAPSVYDTIRFRSDMFLNNPSSLVTEKDAHREFHLAWSKNVSSRQRESVIELIQRLFPRTRVVWNERMGASEYESSEWRKLRHVCATEVFPIYFSLASPEGDMPNVVVHDMIDAISEAKDFADALIALQQNRKARMSLAFRFLERLEDYTDTLSERIIPTLIQGLVDAKIGRTSVADSMTCKMDTARRSEFASRGLADSVVISCGSMIPKG